MKDGRIRFRLGSHRWPFRYLWAWLAQKVGETEREQTSQTAETELIQLGYLARELTVILDHIDEVGAGQKTCELRSM